MKAAQNDSYPSLLHSSSPTHKYYLAADPVTKGLVLSDTNSRQIYRVQSLTGGQTLLENAQVVAGTGEQCMPFDEAHCGDGGKAVEATLMTPRGEHDQPPNDLCVCVCVCVAFCVFV